MNLSAALALAQAVVFVAFVASLVPKARNWRRFVSTVRAFTSIGERPARVVAAALSAGEVAAAALLWSMSTAVVAFAISAALLIAYTVTIGIARTHGSDVGCNCFGQSRYPVSWFDASRNVVFLAACALGLVAALRHSTPAVPSVRGLFLLIGTIVVLLAVQLRDVTKTILRPIGSEEPA